MIVSLNEIELTIRRAALGVGWPYGLAEEAGCAAAWAAAQRLDGVGAALAALAPGPAAAAADVVPGGWRFPAAQVAAAGPSAFDLLAAGDGAERAELAGADAPLLLIGLAGIAAEAYGCGFALAFSGDSRVEVSVRGVTLTGPLPPPGADVVIIRQPGATAQAPALAAEGVTVDDTLWTQALALAARSYVASSEASRLRGAGAGLTDND